MKQATLYALPHSLYSGRVRSYLVKAGIAYRELAPNSQHYFSVVKPKAGGRASLPTIELSNGDVIRDGAAIIDHFEGETGRQFSPKTPKQNFFSRLFDVIGAEGLLRPAMHYRWNFDDQNAAFLEYHFTMLFRPGDGEGRSPQGPMNAMRKAALAFGVTPETKATVEAVYIDQLSALDCHFEGCGYLLGGRPSIGDFGMIAPLFAHLGRDPKATEVMFAKGKRVYRWVERMNRLAADLAEYGDQDPVWLPNDEIAPSLTDVLRALAEDFVPETVAAAHTINEWLAEQSELPSNAPCARAVGSCSFEVRGIRITAIAQPYRFYLLKRAQDIYARMDEDDQKAVDTILEASGMKPILGAKLTREIGRKDNLEIWL
ncbi:MAG: glutathione S-transferase N-terminal domain-containing protein [Pseudomonadota bacterium]